MSVKYKFNPEDFEGMMFLAEDMATFYEAHDAYSKDKTKGG